MSDAPDQYGLDMRHYGNAVSYQVALSLVISAPLFRSYETNVLPALSALVGFCIELALKAFLANRLSDPSVLTKLPARHDLQILLEMSDNQGLQVGDDIKKLVKDLNENHRNHLTRYMPSNGSFPQYDNWLAVVDATSSLCELVGRKIGVSERPTPSF